MSCCATSTATAADSRNPSDNDPDDRDGDDDDEGGGIYGNLTVHDDDTTAGPSQSGRDEELDMGSATGNATEERAKSHPPSPSIALKCPFSTIDTCSDSKSLTPGPSVSHQPSFFTVNSKSTTLSTLMVSSVSKCSQMTGMITLTHVGNNFAGFNEVYWYGVDKEHE